MDRKYAQKLDGLVIKLSRSEQTISDLESIIKANDQRISTLTKEKETKEVVQQKIDDLELFMEKKL